MSTVFTSSELARLEATMQALLSPLAWPDADAWRDVVLERLAQLLCADRALFGLTMPGVDNAYRLFGAEPRDLEPYLAYYCHMDPAARAPVEMPEGVVSTTLLIPWMPGGPTWYYGSELYNDYYRPLGIEDHVSVAVEPSLDPCNGLLWGASAVLTAYRSRYGTELYGDRGVHVMRLLRPALLGGVEALHAVARRRAALVRAIDQMREAVRLCSADGDVLHQNVALSALLASEPERERLEAALRVAATSLAKLSRTRGRSGEIALPRGLGTVATERARYRVRGSLLDDTDTPRAPAMILLLERHGLELSPELLRERLGLTWREAEVACLLAQRRRNREIAALLAISPNTARRHTDAVLLKLGVHSRDSVRQRLVELLDDVGNATPARD